MPTPTSISNCRLHVGGEPLIIIVAPEAGQKKKEKKNNLQYVYAFLAVALAALADFGAMTMALLPSHWNVAPLNCEPNTRFAAAVCCCCCRSYCWCCRFVCCRAALAI